MAGIRTSIVQEGQTISVHDGPLTGSGTVEHTAVAQSDTVLASIFVRALTGTVKVDLYTFAQEGDVKIIDFPLITSPTANLVMKQAAGTLSNVRVVIQHSDDCDIIVSLKGSSSGTSSTVLLSPTQATAYSVPITTTPSVIIPASTQDRQGLILMNYGAGPILYVGFTASEAAVASGWPLPMGASIAIDLGAGQAIWGASSAGTIDVRIMESGS
jgi:hypothetical protein